LRRIAEEGETVSFPDPREEPVEFLGIYHSHPEWLVRRWLGRFGYESTRQLCEFDNEIPSICLRVNRQKGSVEEVVEMLRKDRVGCSPGRYLEYVLRVDGGIVLPDLRAFSEGFVQVQDESAALVGELANPRHGEVAVDLCASPGGKATHIAELMGDVGVVVAVDVSDSRLRPLVQNLERLGLHSVFPVVSDSRYFKTGGVDLVILDVPCSGTGTLRRRPDLRWRRAESDLQELVGLQRKLIENAADIVKPGGRLVYSTCSIEPEENEELVTGFLEDFPQFEVQSVPEWVPRDIARGESCVSTLPHSHGIDGMFACVLVRRPRTTERVGKHSQP
jgi:16S rRNA (cytosine967-C5)-methyltransferase